MVYSNNYCSIEDAWGNLTGKVEKKKKKRMKDPICELYDMSSNGAYDDLDLVQAANMGYDRYNKSKYQKDRQAGREREKFVHIDATDARNHVPLYEQGTKNDDIDLDKQFYSSMAEAQCSRSNIKLPDLESHFDPITSNQEEEEDEEDDDYKEFQKILKKKHHDDDGETEADDDSNEHPRNLLAPAPGPAPMRMRNRHLRDRDFDINENFLDSLPVRNSSSSHSPYLDLMLYIVSGIILIFVMEQFVKIGVMLQ